MSFDHTNSGLDSFLQRRINKHERDECALWAMESPVHLDAVWAHFRAGVDPSQRMAAWVLEKVCDHNRELLRPRLQELIDLLEGLQTDWEKRTAMRTLAAFREYPAENAGHLLDISLAWLNDPLEAIAVRVHAMQVAYNISLSEPDIRGELTLVLESHYAEGSAGFRNRAGKLLARMKKNAAR